MEEQSIGEKFIGGFVTGTFKKAGDFTGGYGVFATTKRIVGVKPSRWFAILLTGSVLGVMGLFSGLAAITHIFALQLAVFGGLGLIGTIIAWGQRRLRRKGPRSIEELEARRDFEIYSSNIARIEMRKPGLVRRGLLRIVPLAGQGLSVLISQQLNDYGRLRDLISMFCAASPQIQLVEAE